MPLYAQPDCYLCLMRQALSAARMAGSDEAQQLVVMRRAMEALSQAEAPISPSEVAGRITQVVQDVTGVADPYRAAKRASTQETLLLYPRLKALVAEATDPLDMAIRLSIAGNIIDVTYTQTYELWKVIEDTIRQPYAGDGLAAFRAALSRAEWVLYLADNAGETVFDRVLIETLGRPVVYAVKSGPVLNDATREDALQAGIDGVARIVETGARTPGTILGLCSEAFRALYDSAAMIISKGQANFETADWEDARLFFLLRVKCPALVSALNAPIGSVVLRQGGNGGPL